MANRQDPNEEGTAKLRKLPDLGGQVWEEMSAMLQGMLEDAQTAVRLRSVDLEAFDKKLDELAHAPGEGAKKSLGRLRERRESLEEEIDGLVKHADDVRFLGTSLDALKKLVLARQALQEQSLAQIAELEGQRESLEAALARLGEESAGAAERAERELKAAQKSADAARALAQSAAGKASEHEEAASLARARADQLEKDLAEARRAGGGPEKAALEKQVADLQAVIDILVDHAARPGLAPPAAAGPGAPTAAHKATELRPSDKLDGIIDDLVNE